MKLELKHLAPYLPYKLKAVDYFEDMKLEREIVPSNIMAFVEGDTKAKPILRPLSEITKDSDFIRLINEELYFDDWEFVVDSWTTLIQLSNNSLLLVIQNEVAPECCLLFYDYMIEKHFDVFGLIENGLAIDINTLKND